MGKSIGKNISKNLSSKYSHKLVDHAKQSAADALKRVIQKSAEATGYFICNKIADKITKISETSLQNNSKKLTNGHDEEIPKERYISPVERQKVIDDLRLIY